MTGAGGLPFAFTISPHTVDIGRGAVAVDEGLGISGDGAARALRTKAREIKNVRRIMMRIQQKTEDNEGDEGELARDSNEAEDGERKVESLRR